MVKNLGLVAVWLCVNYIHRIKYFNYNGDYFNWRREDEGGFEESCENIGFQNRKW